MTFQCYYCDFKCIGEKDYLRHGAVNHLYQPLFPNQTELQILQLKPQDKPWEKPLKTEEEAWEHLGEWAFKRMQEEEKQRIRDGKDAYKHIPIKVLGDEYDFQRRLFTEEELDTMDWDL